MDLDLEEVAMTIGGNAGEARSLAYEALREAKTGNFDKAEELLKESREKSLLYQNFQFLFLLMLHKLKLEIL